jgi:polyisoprenyl-phosphate glycosyltransferase
MPRSDTFVSVVAPLRDDGDIVDAFVRDAAAVLEQSYTNYEIVLVDDGSGDDTAARVDELLKALKCVRYIRLSRHFGTETAIACGLDSVIGDYAVVLAPDGDPPELIPELVERARSGNVAYGVRSDRSGEPLWARAGAAVFYAVANRFLDLPLPKNSSHFLVMSRQVVNGLTRMKDKYRHLRVLNVQVGYASEGVPYAPRWRRSQRRHRGLSESVGLAISMVVGHSTRPLRLLSALGLAASSLNLLYMVYVVGIYLFKDQVAEGWTTMSLQMSFMFFLLFLIAAALSEYVGRILEESRDRPLYHVREERNSNVLVADATRRNVVRESSAGGSR